MLAEKVAYIDSNTKRKTAKHKLITAKDLVDKTYCIAVTAKQLATTVKAFLGYYKTVVYNLCLASSLLLT
jgi:hypothetical protein